MLKKIGLSAAAIFAFVALATPPAAMAAGRDDSRYGDRDDRGRDVRESRQSQERYEQTRGDWRDHQRGHQDRDRDRDRDWR